MRDVRSAVVTGPTGAIGVALCKLLASQGVRVWAVVRPGSPRVTALSGIQSVTLISCDISKLGQLPELLGGGATVDAFFHLAWTYTVGAGRNDMEAQVRNIAHTLDACRVAVALGCSVFVGAGSQAEYGRHEVPLAPNTPCFPENGYGMAKLCAGQMSRELCHQLGVAHVWSRILSVYGPHDGVGSMISSVIRALLAGERPALTAGMQKWDYLYASDAARALWLMALCGHDGAVYPLGSGDARSLRSYIEELRDAIDPALPLGMGELPYGPQQVMRLQADISTLTRDTGFVPEVDFSTGIRQTIEYVKGQLHA